MRMPQISPRPWAAPKKREMNRPRMQKPQASPSPGAQPAASHKTKMNMPGMNMRMPQASRAPRAIQNMPGMENMQGMGSMNMGPLMVMMGNDMGIRVGSSDSNIMSMGAMGSGTTWQPSSGPMHMYHKQSGDWLLMFHYNLIAVMNRQGVPRGLTKAESVNWFSPMGYIKLGKGTGRMRGMLSFKPLTFQRDGAP